MGICKVNFVMNNYCCKPELLVGKVVGFKCPSLVAPPLHRSDFIWNTLSGMVEIGELGISV